ncbi:MAG: hypothetical protein Hyperionvirus7_54 [Hyperionvirus sp.]|uniref:Uncharacterized protein n=1 Tax=Hyperionvirus sp. TaxID=2487770 RepID=A0A3G5AC92_9VIRU|nr:MAG: hypothetical protein Hyperionvirus7_54 [Hyperionvirus sp.]
MVEEIKLPLRRGLSLTHYLQFEQKKGFVQGAHVFETKQATLEDFLKLVKEISDLSVGGAAISEERVRLFIKTATVINSLREYLATETTKKIKCICVGDKIEPFTAFFIAATSNFDVVAVSPLMLRVSNLKNLTCVRSEIESFFLPPSPEEITIIIWLTSNGGLEKFIETIDFSKRIIVLASACKDMYHHWFPTPLPFIEDDKLNMLLWDSK